MFVFRKLVSDFDNSDIRLFNLKRPLCGPAAMTHASEV